MNGIEKIISHITADSSADVEAIKAASLKECEEKRATFEKAAQDEYWKIFKKGTKDAELRVDRLGSVAALEAKKQILATKQEMVSQAFDRAVEQLTALPDHEYVELLTRLAANASRNGQEQIVLSATDRTRFGKTVCIKANETLHNMSKQAALTLSEQTRNIQGGLILSDGDIEVNCSIESLVKLYRNELAAKVAGVLFD